jgi:peptidyl-prolyl cis-trans isomerase SurA
MANRVLILLITIIFSQALFAQKGDPVLFTVGDTPVHLSEFKYIYTKTNAEKADFSKASLQEYLDLYTRFKLKVQKAKEMRLDTVTALKQELEGYRRQLADSYLIDREVTERLIQEAYERTRQDVDLSHILVKIPENATPEDTLAAWNKAMKAKKELEEGERFETAALKYSEDASSSKNRGHVGFVTALFPNGFYNLETAAYSAPINKPVGPIKTDLGYHIMVVHERRPARGEVEVAHILARLDKAPDPIKARLKIDTVYAALKAGENFDQLAMKYSDDKITSTKGGYIGFFGINRYEKAFEDAAFALEKDGDFTSPVQTSIGWHIIKRVSKKVNESLHASRARLQNAIKEDARFEIARRVMVERIKREGNFAENRTTLQNFIASLEQDTAEAFLTYKWKAPEKPSTEPLFAFGNNMKISLGDFQDYAQRASRKRQQFAAMGIGKVANMLYDDFIDESALRFEERQLETKYPEFKSLMREYEEGVLLFEVTKMEVWDKASQDTTGLKAFYENNKTKYIWDERAQISQYSLAEKAQEQINKLREFASSNTSDVVLTKFNPADGEHVLSFMEKTYERGRNDVLDKMTWTPGALSAVEISKRDKSLNFFKIEKVLPPTQKTLQEARGYVVADYQDFLEKQWLEQLKKAYKVKVNEKVFNSMTKK